MRNSLSVFTFTFSTFKLPQLTYRDAASKTAQIGVFYKALHWTEPDQCNKKQENIKAYKIGMQQVEQFPMSAVDKNVQ